MAGDHARSLETAASTAAQTLGAPTAFPVDAQIPAPSWQAGTFELQRRASAVTKQLLELFSLAGRSGEEDTEQRIAVLRSDLALLAAEVTKERMAIQTASNPDPQN